IGPPWFVSSSRSSLHRTVATEGTPRRAQRYRAAGALHHCLPVRASQLATPASIDRRLSMAPWGALPAEPGNSRLATARRVARPARAAFALARVSLGRMTLYR